MSPLEMKKYLTPLMIQVKELRDRNYTRKEIAGKLGCTVHNVKRAIQRMKGRV